MLLSVYIFIFPVAEIRVIFLHKSLFSVGKENRWRGILSFLYSCILIGMDDIISLKKTKKTTTKQQKYLGGFYLSQNGRRQWIKLYDCLQILLNLFLIYLRNIPSVTFNALDHYLFIFLLINYWPFFQFILPIIIKLF